MRRWLILALFLTACGQPSEAQIQAAIAQTAQAMPTVEPTPDACSPAVLTAYGTAMKGRLDLYFAQLGITQSTSRIGMGPVMQSLFEVEQTVNAQTPPPCLTDWFGRTKNMMELYRTGLNQFSAQDENNSLINMTKAAALRTVVETGLLDIIAGKVPALP